MKKFFAIIAMIFLFSGCTINYNIEIKNNKVNEQIEITELKENVNEDLAEKFKNEKIYSQYNNSGIKEYEKSEKEKNNKKIYSLNQNYDLMDYKFARALTECFDAVNLVLNEDNNYIFQTSKGFKCMIYNYYPIDSYKVNITMNYEVINTNADSVNGNIYTWNINSNNADNKYINIEFKEEQKKEDISNIEQNKRTSINPMSILLIMGAIIGLAIIITIYALNLNKKRNKL